MRRKAFTLIELLVVVAIIALLISILLPSLARARELSKRTVCGKNLSGIGQAVAAYASETGNAAFYPIPAHATTIGAGTSAVTYMCNIGINRNANTTTGSATLSATRCLWMLIRAPKSPVTPKLCICPSSDGNANTDPEPKIFYDFGINGVGGTAPTYPSPDNYKQVSYGFQVPFGTVGKGSSERDVSMPLAADKGYYSAYIEVGTALPATSNISGSSMTSVSQPEDWKRFNSPNHGGRDEGEGQNVLYSDFHVDFQRNPIVGIGMDNIYTRWASATAPLIDRIKGSIGDQYAPYANTDTLIYP